MQKISNPIPLFLDARGNLLDGGSIYIGTAYADPETQPLVVFYDRDLSVRAAQPLRTYGGQVVDENLSPTLVFVAEDDFSIRIKDADGAQVNSVPSIFEQQVALQPLDSDLSAIANEGTTPYGRSLLRLAGQPALRAATGIPAPLPLAGGIMTGDITRQGAGAVPYFASSAYPSVRIFVGPVDAGDPTSQAGDVWLSWE